MKKDKYVKLSAETTALFLECLLFTYSLIFLILYSFFY